MNAGQKIMILGLGQTGTRVVSKIASSGITGFDFAALDSDQADLEKAAPNVQRVYVGNNWAWREGSGCGGDVLHGEQVVAPHRAELAELLKERKMVIVTAGLGGGLATGGIRTVASVINTLHVPAVFMLTTPFVFESFSRRKAANECIDELRPIVDVLIRLPNDLLFSMISSDTPIQQAFELSCSELARSVIGIASILNAEQNLNADFDGFMAQLKNRKCHCGFGVGCASASDGDRCTEATKRLLLSPFLGGAQNLNDVDAAIVSICGGPDLQFGETKRCLENVSALLPEKTAVLSGFSTAEYMNDAVQVMMITIRNDEPEQMAVPTPAPLAFGVVPEQQPQPQKTKARKARRRDKKIDGFEEVELPLQTLSKGIFSNTNAGFWNNVDLDIPTYQRLGVSYISGRGNAE